MPARFSLRETAQSLQLLVRLGGFPGACKGEADPVVHPNRQIVGHLQQLLALRRQFLPHGLWYRLMAEHLKAPLEFSTFEQRQGGSGRAPIVLGQPGVAQDGLRLGQVPEVVWIPLD